MELTAFFFFPQLNSCVGTKYDSWFQFCQLLERLYHSPSRGISHSSTWPSQKHRRCCLVLSKNYPTTTTKTPSLVTNSPSILSYSVSTNKNTLSEYTGHRNYFLKTLIPNSCFLCLTSNLVFLLQFFTSQLQHGQLRPSYSSSRSRYT